MCACLAAVGTCGLCAGAAPPTIALPAPPSASSSLSPQPPYTLSEADDEVLLELPLPGWVVPAEDLHVRGG